MDTYYVQKEDYKKGMGKRLRKYRLQSRTGHHRPFGRKTDFPIQLFRHQCRLPFKGGKGQRYPSICLN